MAAAIDASELRKVYRSGVPALNGVSFAVPAGQVFGYLGRNGSGKTTTVRILTTLTTPTSGQAFVAGHDVIRRPAHVRQSIGVTMQDAALDLAATGREHLEFVARLWRMSRADAARQASRLLERFELAKASDRLIGTYSGGMRRRLDIATALLNHPSILFLDEPTTGLDAQSRRAVWSEIERLKMEGTTVFLTTQYIEEAERLADRVAIVVNGSIAACDTPSRLKANIGRTTVELRLSDPSRRDALLRLLAGSAQPIPAPGGLMRFELADNGASARRIHEVLTDLRDQGVGLDGLSIRESSLEDAFVRLTGDGAEKEVAS